MSSRLRIGLAFENLHVLIVDDNANSRRVIAEILEQRGIRPVTAECAAAAIEEIRSAGLESDPIRVVFLDTGVAGENGTSLMSELRRYSQSGTEFILMFPSTDAARDMTQSNEWGVANHVIKPIVQSELLHVLENAIAPARRAGGIYGPQQPGTGRRPLRVLLAEDNEVNRELAVALLEGMGHAVTVASDGYAVLKAVEERVFDVLLMDLQMPRLDGLEATREIRRRERTKEGSSPVNRLPIVAVTAHALSMDRDACLAAGMDVYITKPIRRRELMEALDQLFPPCTGF